jgi:acetylornithine deacetylase/succinyl-diaminopimelate desuccinylase-like protein
MKAGLATALMTAQLVSEHRDALAGELVVTCVGDEETGGRWGTEYLLDNVSYCRGDAVLNADAGSPRVLRFGEKGQLWIELRATGLANHGAHVHLGRNAIEPLLEGIRRCLSLRTFSAPLPSDVLKAMEEARDVSEKISGAGEFDTLSHVTVNVGTIAGGSVVNIIPDMATARLDIRIPPGVTVKAVVARVSDLLSDLPALNFEIQRSCDPTVTSPSAEIATLVLANARALLGPDVVANMRVGMSDARFYRVRGMPTIVYGPAPHNMGGIDEYVMVEDIQTVFHVHAMTAFDYLAPTRA